MSFNFGTVLSNGFSSFSDDERLNYALKLSLNRIQTWGETPWYEEPQALSSTLPNLILKNKIPSFSEIEQYYIVDPDLGKATNITVNKGVGSADYNNMTIKTIHESTHTSNIPIRLNNGTENVNVINNGETKTLLKGVSKKMIAKYVYWKNGLTGKKTNNNGSTPTATDGDKSGTFPDKTEPYASFMTLSNKSENNFINDRRWSTLESEYTTLYNNLDQYYSGLQIIHWSNIQSDGTAPLDKRHPFFKIFIGLPTYSTYSNALKAKFNNLGVGNSQSGDNIGFTNKLLEGAMGSINNYNFYISTWNKKQGKFVKRGEDTYGAGEQNTNILYFVSYSGFILNYGEENILVGKGDNIDKASISIMFPPTISFIKYVGDTFSDGIIAQGTTLPAVEVSNVKDLFIRTTDNTIHRLEEENNGNKTWVGIGGSGGGSSGGGSSGSTQTYTNQILEQSGNEIQVPNDKHTLPFNQFTDVSGSETSFTFNSATTQLIYKFSFNLTWNSSSDRGDTISEYQLMVSEQGGSFNTKKTFRLRNSLFSENFATIEHIIEKGSNYSSETTITVKLQGKSINPDYLQKVNYSYFNSNSLTGEGIVKPILEITKIGSRTIEAEALFNKNSNGNIFYTNGNVGIGTNNPTNQLEVSGNTLLLNDLTVNGLTNSNNLIIDNYLKNYNNDIILKNEFNSNITPTKLLPNNGASGDRFGSSVSISGDYAIVGASFYDFGSKSDTGMAYIYKKNNSGNWIQETTLLSSEIDVGHYFGQSVYIHGKYAIVGAFGLTNTGDTGRAYIFERDSEGNWGKSVPGQSYRIENIKLLATGVSQTDRFAYSVAINDNYAVVGASNTNNYTGTAYIYEKDVNGNWGKPGGVINNIVHRVENAELRPLDITNYNYFGYDVDISDKYVIVGTEKYRPNQVSESGAAYIFERDNEGNWGKSVPGQSYRKENVKLMPSDSANDNRFGKSVGISKNYAIVGAYNYKNQNGGSAYIFERDSEGNWGKSVSGQSYRNENIKLLPSYGEASQTFGSYAKINNNYAIVGSSINGFIFKKDDNGNWGTAVSGESYRTENKTIIPTNNYSTKFGGKLSISKYNIIFGVSNDNNNNGIDTGSASIYKFLISHMEIDDFIANGNVDGIDKLMDKDKDTKITTALSDANQDNKLRFFTSGEQRMIIDDNGIIFNNKLLNNNRDTIYENINLPDKTTTFTSIFPKSDSNFGYQVAIFGKYAIFTQRVGTIDGVNLPLGLIYEEDENGDWNLKNTVAGSDADWDFFNGVAGQKGIAINNDYAFISSYKAKMGGSGAKGAVYVYKRNIDNTWGNSFTTQYNIENQKLTASGGPIDYFGYSVAVSGNYLIIGAYGNPSEFTQKGIAYIFELSNGTWIQKHTLVSSVRTDYDQFGYSVGITDNYAIVGAYGNSTLKGAAYIFEKGSDGNWGVAAASGTDRNETLKLVASDSVENQPYVYPIGSATGDSFGKTVAISGNYVIVGAPYNDVDEGFNNRQDSGAAYIFERDDDGNWGVAAASGTDRNETLKLVASNRQVDDQFGWNVAIDGNYAIVAAYIDNAESIRGRAYIFKRDSDGTWGTMVSGQTYSSETMIYPVYGYNLGFSIDLSNRNFIFGQNFFQNNANNSGRAFISKFFFTESTLTCDIIGVDNIKTNKITGENNFVIYKKTSYLQEFSQKQKIIASNATSDLKFGSPIGIYDDYAIVGAPGNAYIFERGSDGIWLEKNKLSPSTSADNFGTSVAIYGNYAIVGAWGYDLGTSYNIGAAFIFERSSDGNWGVAAASGTDRNETVMLLAKSSVPGFGFSVAINKNYAIVGSIGTATIGTAYIFERDINGNWGEAATSGITRNETQKLLASDGNTGNKFGYSVSISNNYVIVGAYGNYSGSASGSAYIFELIKGSWTQKNKLSPSDGGSNDNFGFSVAIDGTYAIIGSINNNLKGSAYIFERSSDGNWGKSVSGQSYRNETQKLQASNGGYPDYFGTSVAIYSNYAIVGAYAHDIGTSYNIGTCYIFKRDSGTTYWGSTVSGQSYNIETKIIVANDGVAQDNFGRSVAISNNYVIVGAPNHQNIIDGYYLSKSGTAYIFENALSDQHFLTSNNLVVNKLNTETTIQIGTGGNDYKSKIFIGGGDSNQKKTAIISEPVGPWCKSNLHFCLNTDDNFENARVIDSKLTIFNNGNVDVTGRIKANGFTDTSSDDRIKHNEQKITNALVTISKLQPMKYFKTQELYNASHNFILNSEGNPVNESGDLIDGYHIEAGLIAQDLLKIDELKYAVSGLVEQSGNLVIPSDKPLSVSYDNIFMHGIQGIKELHIQQEKHVNDLSLNKINLELLKIENAELKTEVNLLKTENSELKTELSTLKSQMSDVLTRLSQLESN